MPFGITFALLAEVFTYGMIISTFFPSIFNLSKAYRSSQRKMPLSNILVPWFLPSVLSVVALYWALYSPSNIIDRDPRAFYWAICTVYCNILVCFCSSKLDARKSYSFNLTWASTLFYSFSFKKPNYNLKLGELLYL
ncbi:hypothetical protein AB6A40_008264 [Gnathostoma spinigerum]|uniref:Uncharacterized protein n=1 Tax=Gnathostoma spinigerum TaxID=75299 RepID=A0ABD6EZ51_9BILA